MRERVEISLNEHRFLTYKLLESLSHTSANVNPAMLRSTNDYFDLVVAKDKQLLNTVKQRTSGPSLNQHQSAQKELDALKAQIADKEQKIVRYAKELRSGRGTTVTKESQYDSFKKGQQGGLASPLVERGDLMGIQEFDIALPGHLRPNDPIPSDILDALRVKLDAQKKRKAESTATLHALMHDAVVDVFHGPWLSSRSFSTRGGRQPRRQKGQGSGQQLELERQRWVRLARAVLRMRGFIQRSGSDSSDEESEADKVQTIQWSLSDDEDDSD
ncbi:hypothetical protein DYB32_004291 [Aphanomyces invadans]|uniref:Uncharacterized protein n=1 Tax=Aphanomyces invadans TaxID=157072 RepID=A0A418AXZ6_9STRA|nr:hypothetical protein DYB32_004291 [Aphanomyces invadans]